MRIFIDVEPLTNRVRGWGSTPVSDNSIEIEVDDNSSFFSSFPTYVYVDGELMGSEDILLENAKIEKDAELNKACNESILAGFKYEVDGIEYHFSFDNEAQFNFHGSERILSKGLIDKIMWTVQKDGEYTRIPVDKALMDELMLAILVHKDSNVSKYRDFLMPLVKEAKTPEEVAKITWNYEKEELNKSIAI